jgi:hypothetical protein
LVGLEALGPVATTLSEFRRLSETWWLYPADDSIALVVSEFVPWAYTTHQTV